MLPDEKRHVIVMLRWVLIIALSYVVVFSAHAQIEVSAVFVGLFLTSNLVLMRLPDSVFQRRAFDVGLVAIDLTSITVGLWLCGSAGPDFFFLFFFVVFLAALGERPALTATGASLAAAAYLLFLYPGSLWSSELLLRLPFLFMTALMYGYLATTAREARARAQAAELTLGTMSQELRAPLSVIIRYGEMLRADRLGNLTPGQREGISEINLQAVQLLELIVRRMADVLGEGKKAEPEAAGADQRAR